MPGLHKFNVPTNPSGLFYFILFLLINRFLSLVGFMLLVIFDRLMFDGLGVGWRGNVNVGLKVFVAQRLVPS